MSVKFKDCLTSDKGMVKLVPYYGKEFLFRADNIEMVRPYKTPDPSWSAPYSIGILNVLAGTDKAPYVEFAEIVLRGRYSGSVFVDKPYSEIYMKVNEAMVIAYKISKKQYGDFS